MKTKRFKSIITLVVVVLMVRCIDQAKAGASSELARIGDFSIGLADIEREENTAILHFAITKVSDTDSGHQSLQVSLVDDHENEYSGNLDINLEGASDVTLNALPKGFTYLHMVSISMPKIAPIQTIKLGDIKEIAFKKVKFGKPQFMKNFGNLAITKGQSVAVPKWLSFTMGHILPAPGYWELPITIENREYNPLPAGVKVAVQHGNGTISWSHDESTTVPALSKTSVKVAIPIPSWVKVGPPQPKVLLNVYSDRSPDKGKTILRIFPITLSDLPPLVGQGPKEIEDVFLEAYKRNGGQERVGNPLDLPHWFAGADRPNDEKDVLVQEFPSVSDSGKSVIIWAKQSGAKQAFVMHGELLARYQKTEGPYHELRPNILLGAPTSDEIIATSSFKTKGKYHTFKTGVMIYILAGSLKGQTFTVYGKIYEKWKEKGFVQGLLGFPIENEQTTSSGAEGFATMGWVQSFEGGNVYHHTTGRSTGQTFVIQGNVYQKYKNLKAEKGWLGFPISEQYRAKYTFDAMNFEAGYITTNDGRKWKAFFYEGRITKIVFSDGSNIYTIDVDGKNKVNLTKDSANNRFPSWSPDGSRIAFISNRGDSKGIYVMNADGSNTHQVAKIGKGEIIEKYKWTGWERYINGERLQPMHPTWFPDGSKMVFSNKGQIFIANIDGSGLKQLTFPQEIEVTGPLGFHKCKGATLNFAPVILPNGRIIFDQLVIYKIPFENFAREKDPGCFSINVNGTDMRRATKDEIESTKSPSELSVNYDGTPISFTGSGWSPSRKRFAFISNKNIYAADVTGWNSPTKNVRRVTWWERFPEINKLLQDRRYFGEDRIMYHHLYDLQVLWQASYFESTEHKEKISLTYNVDQFTPESATGIAFSLPVRSEGYEAYFPWVASHIDTAWSVILLITFQVTDPGGIPISGAKIFMGQQKLGVTDSSGKFTYKYVVRIPKRENKITKLPFSAKKNGASCSVDIPFSWSVLATTSIHIATKEDLDRYTKILYQYEFFESKLPLPKELTPLSAFLPLLKVAYDRKIGPKIGDRIDILLIEHKIDSKEPVAWAYWEQINRGEEIPYYATGWILSPKDKQRILDTYFLIKKA